MRYERVIWDFNGTLLDDLRVCIDSADELLQRYGLQPIGTVEKYYGVFGFPIIEYYKRIGFDFNKVDYTTLAHEWVSIYLEKVKKAALRSGAAEVISQLRNKGIKQSVFSMTESNMLISQINDLGISHLFDEIIGKTDIYASGKLSLAAEWKNTHENERTVYIGDTLHDLQSADIIGADCILITGGHESTETLRKSTCKIVNDPSELIPLILK